MKNKIILLLAVLLTAFVLIPILPTLTGNSDGYQQKAVNIPVVAPATPVAEPAEAEPTPEPVVAAPEVTSPDTAPEAAEADLVAEPAPIAEPETTPEATEPPATVDVQTHEVKAQVTAYNPLVLFINPGDQVAWSNMNGHDTQSLEGMIPEGAEMWHSKMGDNYSHTFTVEGVYFYKCTPHWGTGMGGVIVVGKPSNLDIIKGMEVKGAGKRLVKKALKAIDAHSF